MLKQTFHGATRGMRRDALNAFRLGTDYNSFNQSYGNGVPSIQDIHNPGHGLVGGDGYMSYQSIAGFDPIFFLHHWFVYPGIPKISC